jgi:hypothetical protein
MIQLLSYTYHKGLGGGRAVAIHQRCMAVVYSTELGNLGMRIKDLLDRIREEEEEDKHLLGIMRPRERKRKKTNIC